jgi:hypothetical protein
LDVAPQNAGKFAMDFSMLANMISSVDLSEFFHGK